jgi:signal transduction histidine kinase/CheY-like chemotaxis protein
MMKGTLNKRVILVILTGFILIGLVYGVCTATEKSDGESMISETLDFLKKQCAKYDNQVATDKTKTQVTLLEKAEELSRQLEGKTKAEMSDYIDEYAKNMRISGVILLDSEGKPYVENYQDDTDYESWSEVLGDTNVTDVLKYPKKRYISHVEKEDGSVYDYVAISPDKRGGILFAWIKESDIEIANRESGMLDMLTGYQMEMGGIAVISKGDRILTSNADIYPSVETCKKLEEKDSGGIICFDGKNYLGGYAKTGDYTLYALFPKTEIYRSRLIFVAFAIIFYVLFLLIVQYLKQREVERAESQRLKFLRQMSHDIRTPINGIRGMIRIAESAPEDMAKQKECRRKIWEASDFLIDLVNDVLEMGKLDNGEMRMEECAFDMVELLESATAVMEGAADHNGIEIKLEPFEGSHRKLIGSSPQLSRILNNVISNAIKYNNKENGQVWISCRETEDKTEDGQIFYEIKCRDNGIGMSREFQKKMYDQFTQENEVGEVAHHGTGLGLAIVKSLVDQMHGSISCESKRNDGTTFTIRLPFTLDTEAEELEKQVVSDENKNANPLEGVSVLLVEDNEMNMEIAEFILEELGMKITEAWNGQEAVQIFEESKPGDFDVILMDMMMPVMNGEEATRAIRALSRKDAGTIPIIAATANAFAEDVEAAKAAGMNDHLAKPIDIQPLRDMILKYL